jgi:hypothetical protein
MKEIQHEAILYTGQNFLRIRIHQELVIIYRTGIREELIRIRMFLGLLDPSLSCMDPDLFCDFFLTFIYEN